MPLVWSKKEIFYMKIKSWPRLAQFEERLLEERKLQMEEMTELWERFALLPLIALSIVCSVLAIVYGQPSALLFIAWVNMFAFAVYGFTRFPGRITALFLKRLDLKKHQIFRHAAWHTRRGIRSFLKRFFHYRRFKDTPDENGEFRNETIII